MSSLVGEEKERRERKGSKLKIYTIKQYGKLAWGDKTKRRLTSRLSQSPNCRDAESNQASSVGA